MTTITLSRAVVEQALEALKYLRETAICSADTDTANEVIPALEDALAQQAVPVEPVAWVRLEAWKSGKNWPDDCFTALPAEGLTPVYTPPPQRKPLTEEEIDELSRTMVKGDKSVNWLCRAVERSHGIGGQE